MCAFEEYEICRSGGMCIAVATVKTLLVRSLKTLRGIVSDTALLLVLVYREDGGKRSDLGMFTKKLV